VAATPTIGMIEMIGIDNLVVDHQTTKDREVRALDVVQMITTTDLEEIGTIVAGIEVDLGTESSITGPPIITVDLQVQAIKTLVKIVI